MKTHFPKISCAQLLLAAVAIGMLATRPATAGTDYWLGGNSSGNWSSGANWLSGNAPVPYDALIFTNMSGGNNTPNDDFANGTPFDGIIFTNSTGTYSLSGNSILLSGQTNGVNIGITNATSLLETVGNNLSLDWGYYIFGAGGTLALNGTLVPNTGAVAYFGSGVTSSSLTVDSSGIISGLGGSGLIMGSSGGVGSLVTLSGNSIVAYTFPGSQIASGVIPTNGITGTNIDLTAQGATTYTFPMAANSNLYIGSIESDNTVTNTVLAWGSATTHTNVIIGVPSNIGVIYTPSVPPAQRLTIGSGNGSYLTAGPMSGPATPGEVIFGINGTNTSNDAENNANVIDNASGGHVSVVKVGTGSMYFANTNGYSGGTYVDQGYLQINSSTGLGSGPVYVAAGAELYLQASGGTWANNFNISPGTGVPYSQLGAIKIGNSTSTMTISGSLNLMGIPVTNAPGDKIGASGNGGTVQFRGQITGTGTLELDDLAGTGDSATVNLTNSSANLNNWTGGMLINPAGSANSSLTVKIAQNNQINSNDVTIFDNGSGTSRLDMDSHNDTIGALNSGAPGNGNIEVDNAETGTPTLTIGADNASGSFAGNVGLAGTGLNIAKIGSGTQVLSGANSYIGSTFIGGGTLVLSGPANLSASSQIAVSSATLDESRSAVPYATNSTFSLTNAIWTVSIPQNPATIEAATTLNLGGTTNIINISSLPFIASYPVSFPLISYTTQNGSYNIGLGSLPSSSTPYVGSIVNSGGVVSLVLSSGPTVQILTWTGTDPGNPNNWDVGTSVNWVTPGLAPSVYQQFDFVTFNDSATGSKNINVTTAVTPAVFNVSNSAVAYTLSGSGSIGGATGLAKQGTNLLVVDENNTFSGGSTIGSGTIQLGTGDGNGTLGSGVVVNNGAMVFDRPGNNQIVSNNISGAGTLTEEGNDVLELAGFNTFTGNILVTNNSVLQQATSNSFGFNNTITIANGSSLDLQGHAALNGNKVVVQGSGSSVNVNGLNLAAIDNSATNQIFPGLSNVTMMADTTFGASGSVGNVNSRWDLRSPGGDSANPGTSILSTGGNPYNLTKVGPGFVGIVSTTVDPQLANVDVQNGTLNFEGTSTCLGNPTNTLTIEGFSFTTQGTFQLWNATNQLNKVIVLNDGGTLWNGSGNNAIVGPVSLDNSGGANFCYVEVSSGSLTLSGPLTGDGTLYQEIGTNLLILNGISTNFQGGVEIHAGKMTVSNILVNALGVVVDPATTLTVNGILGGPNGVNNNGAVAGSGVISNLLDNSGTIAPGTAPAPTTLTVGGLTLEGSGQATYNFNDTNTIGGGVNDLIAVNGNVTINGGTINVRPIGLLQLGAPYTIITYTGSLTQNGSLSVTPVEGYTFTVSTATPGQINIVPVGGPPAWNGGSTNNSNWSDSNNWAGVTIVPNEPLLFAGTNRLHNTNDTAAGTSYSGLEFVSGAGAFVLNGNSIVLGGSGIINQSTNAQVVDFPLSINSAQTLNGASGPLIIGAGVTNTLSNNSLTLSGTGILTNLFYSIGVATNGISTVGTNANWTIVDNPTHVTNTAPWFLELTNGTLIFGNAGSAPNFLSTSLQGQPTDNQLGYSAGQTATLIISNGTYTTSSRMNTGPVGGATGVVDVVNGTLSVASQFQGANGALTAGSWINVSGGTFTTPGTIFVSSRGAGFLNVSGTGVVSCAALDVSRNAGNGGAGAVNLNGGTINCSSVATETANNGGSGSPTATFNFNGGILLAKANSATFYQGALTGPPCPIASFVQAGGAIINDGGFSIGINEPLQSGTVQDGGLTKLGVGTVTLNKANTYNGPTTIAGGTLALGATGSIPNSPLIDITGGATFSVASTYVLGSSQTLSNSSSTATINGSVNATAAKLSLTYNSTPSLVVSNGTFTLAVGTALTINNTSGTPLPVGVYTIIAGSASGSVAGVVPSSFTVTGAGTQASQPVAIQISAGSLILIVGTPASPAVFTGVSVNGATLTLTATNGAQSGQFVLLETTNLTLPISQWTPILTNAFDNNGNLNLSTNIINPNNAQEFYLLQMP